MRPLPLMLAAAATLALSACATQPVTGSASGASSTAPRAAATSGAQRADMASRSALAQATANLTAASGSLVSGRLILDATGDGVRVSGEVGGLNRNGVHAFHIHEHGDCSAADASSAGGHFNPSGQPHGRAQHGAHHLGDADNLRADGNGVAKVNAHFRGVVLGGGAANDVIGKAIVVHADPDDYQSQPAGNAGKRIACGVIQAPGLD